MATIEQKEFSEESFHVEIAEATAGALHDTAQPMSIAVGTLELALRKRGGVEDCVRYMTAALSELRTVVIGMNHAHELVHLHHPVPDISPLAVTELLGDIINAFEDRFLQAGTAVTLHAPPPNLNDQITGSRSRICQVVDLIFSYLLPALAQCEVLDITVHGSSLAVGIGMTAHRSHATMCANVEGCQKEAKSSARGWNLVQAMVERLGGCISLERVPCRIVLELPRAQYRLARDGKLSMATSAS